MDQKRIYQIYKACRLCGAGGGYKMPIYQNFVNVDDIDLDIGKKIRECVQIEVYDGDKMPPLICEICVDKLDDYYHFKELCKSTDAETKKKLGLPVNNDRGMSIQSVKQEPNEISKADIQKAYSKKENALKQSENKLKNKAKELKTKEDNIKQRESKLKALDTELKSRQQELKSLDEKLQARETEIQKKKTELDKFKEYEKERAELKKLVLNYKKKEYYWKSRQEQCQKKSEAEIEKLKLEIKRLKTGSENLKRKKESESDEVDRSSRASSVSSKPAKRSKRSLTPNKQEDVEKEVPLKKTKEKEVKPETPALKKVKMTPPKSASVPPEANKIVCVVCRLVFKNNKARANHLRIHDVTFTPLKLACDACKLWFETTDEVANHHRSHKTDNIPYKCDYCLMEFTTEKDYLGHFSLNDCTQFYMVPDVQCLDCWNYYATETLKSQHRCLGEDGRPGGECAKCKSNISVWKDLIIHEATCKGALTTPCIVNHESVKTDPDVLAKLLPIQVRLVKCDALIKRNKSGYCNVGTFEPSFGLDKNCIYPYLPPSKLKQETVIPIDHMVSINPEFKDEFFADDIHWDSDEDSEGEQANKSLTTLCLKVIFSEQMLGKVQRKKRKVKTGKAFDGLSDNEKDYNIGNIIDSLDNDIDDNVHDNGHINGDKDKRNIDSNYLDSNFNSNSNIKLLKIDFDNEEATENTESVLYYKSVDINVESNVLQVKNANEIDSKVEINEQSFLKVDSFDSNEKTVKDINKKQNSDTVIENCEDLSDNPELISINDNSISNRNKDQIELVNNTNSNADSCDSNHSVYENSRNIQNDNLDINSAKNYDDNLKINYNDERAIQNEDLNLISTKADDNNLKINHIDEKAVQNENLDNNIDVKINTDVITDENSITENNDKSDNPHKNNPKVNEHKTDNALTEMDTLMQDLSHLSKTDEQNDHKFIANNTKSDSDAENAKFMMELDEQIGETNKQTDNVKENKHNESNAVKKVNNDFDDLNQINKELEQRMDRDLDNISDGEFDFDA